MRPTLRAAPLTVFVVVVVAVASVVGFFFFRDSADQQEHTLLEADASQAALYVGSVFSGVGSLLDSLADVVSLSNGSPSAFATRAQSMKNGAINLVLAERHGTSYAVTSEVGSAYSTGEVLPPAVSDTLAGAGATLDPGPVVFNGRRSTSAIFAIGPPLVPAGDAVFMQFSLDPFIASPITAAKPFALLKVALYGSPRASPSSLLVATVGPGSLPLRSGPVTALSTVGTAKWALVAEERSPLIGSFAREAPYIILALGLFVAALVGFTVEELERRQRYANRLVDERTADLQATLSDLREAQDALVRGERLTALGEMASVVGHELRNPLAAVTNALYLLRLQLGEPAGPTIEKHLAMVERETAKAAALAEDLTAFVRPREPQKAPVPLPDLLSEVVETAPAPGDVVLEVEAEPLSVEVDRRQMAEVLTNLVTNAYQAIDGEGRVRITARRHGAEAELSVEDSGPGLDTGLNERVFEPFFTTKHDGTGLGLAIVRRLVEAHGGQVAFEQVRDGCGARVVVRLPVGAGEERL